MAKELRKNIPESIKGVAPRLTKYLELNVSEIGEAPFIRIHVMRSNRKLPERTASSPVRRSEICNLFLSRGNLPYEFVLAYLRFNENKMQKQ